METIMWPNKKQAAENNSTAIQADVIQNLTIEQGLKPKEVEIYCLGLFESNFPRLRDAAAQQAEQNIEIFAKRLKKEIEENVEKILIDNFSDPDVQFLLNDVVTKIARNGDKAHTEILIELIQNRISKTSNDFDNLICNQAVTVIDKLTKAHIELLAFIRIVNNFLPSIDLVSSIDEKKLILILKKIDNGVSFFGEVVNEAFDLSYIQAKYLESSGLLHFDNSPFSYSSTGMLHTKINNSEIVKYKIKEEELDKLIFDISKNYFVFLKTYDEIFKNNFVSLSFIGEKIADSYLKSKGLYKVFENYRNFESLE